MQLKTDHSFHIGEQHLRKGKPNQDYALSGMIDDTSAYAIVSDGCSSGGKTDIGSRLMALALKQALEAGPQPTIVNQTTAYLNSSMRMLGLEQKDMLATGLLAIASDNQLVSTLVLGDGVVVEKSIIGGLIARKYEWSDNTPFYLTYNNNARKQFLERKPVLTIEHWHISDGDNHKLIGKETPSPFMTISNGSWWSYEPPHGPWNLNSIAVMSDGVLQVDEKPWQQVVWELVNFKSTSGQFATRRMNRFLREAKTVGRGPQDDIAMAVIHLDQNPKT